MWPWRALMFLKEQSGLVGHKGPQRTKWPWRANLAVKALNVTKGIERPSTAYLAVDLLNVPNVTEWPWSVYVAVKRLYVPIGENVSGGPMCP